MNHDPYLPPQAAVVAAPVRDIDEDGCWRNGRDLFVRRGAALPPRCITCNAPALTPAEPRTVYWHNPWLYVLVLVNLLVYIIVAAIARVSVRGQPGFCGEHAARRGRLKRIAWSLAVGGLGVCFVGEVWSALAGGVAVVLAIAMGMHVSTPLRARNIDDRRAQLRGCGDAFLASLPARR